MYIGVNVSSNQSFLWIYAQVQVFKELGFNLPLVHAQMEVFLPRVWALLP